MLSGRGLCDELITRPEESYRLCCVVVCDLETSRMGTPYIYDISHLRVKRIPASPHKPVTYSVVSHYVKFDKMKKQEKSKRKTLQIKDGRSKM